MSRTRVEPVWAILCLAAAVGFLGACSTTGRPFDADRIAKIQMGVTTLDDVRGMFGDPQSVEIWGHGGAEWNYLHEEETRRDTGMLSRIVRSIASFFVRPIFFPPVNVEYKNNITHELMVYFDSNGVVSNYKYAKTEVPSKRVY